MTSGKETSLFWGSHGKCKTFEKTSPCRLFSPFLTLNRCLPFEAFPGKNEEHDGDVRAHPESCHCEDDSGCRFGILLTFDHRRVGGVQVGEVALAEHPDAGDATAHSVATARHDGEEATGAC